MGGAAAAAQRSVMMVLAVREPCCAHGVSDSYSACRIPSETATQYTNSNAALLCIPNCERDISLRSHFQVNAIECLLFVHHFPNSVTSDTATRLTDILTLNKILHGFNVGETLRLRPVPLTHNGSLALLTASGSVDVNLVRERAVSDSVTATNICCECN